MAKKDASEATTKGLTQDHLKDIEGYPSAQNTTVDGVTWFKEDSYKGTDYKWLVDIFKKASKKQTYRSKGTPDYMVTLNDSNIIVVIECKGSLDDHSMFDDVKEYEKYGYGTAAETEKYAINGALWYAAFLKDYYDVVFMGVSGQTKMEARVTSYVWPKSGDIGDVKLIEDGHFDDALVSIKQYEKDVEVVLDRFAATEEAVRKELRRYTLDCANFLRQNGIEDNSKAGFISAVILGLTNQESALFKNTKNAIEQKRATKSKKLLTDSIGRDAVNQLKHSLYGEGDPFDPAHINGIWDIDEIPQGKRISLKKFYDGLLAKDELLQAPKGKDKYFSDGDTVLSCCVYSLYEHVIEVIDKYSGIDVMGEFYTTFLRFTKGNAKEKGIVLTPKHITDLFCDIAEYYSGEKFTEDTKIIDICCGTGAFLISSLNRIKANIYAESISEEKKEERYSAAQKKSLIGVEKDPSMYALSYANMRFHGDGKSNLFNCSSLLIDSYAPVDDSGKTYIDNKQVTLNEALAAFKSIDIGMINPPYSLDKKDSSSTQEYDFVKRINELVEKNKKIDKLISNLKKKKDGKSYADEIKEAQAKKKTNEKAISKLEAEFSKSGMREVAIQKGQSELDFVASMLHYLKKGGIGIAILPMSCAGTSGSELRAKILEYHTLLACMTMPPQLFFDSHIGQATCIMVFKAHVPHDNQKSTFFGRWQDDGFNVIPHNGRKDSGTWNDIRKTWIDQIDGMASKKDTVWLRHKINHQGEALPEAYVQTDFSKINDEVFKLVVRKYSLYKYMEKNSALDVKDSERLNWLLDNYTDFEKQFSGVKNPKSIKLDSRKWETFKLRDIIPTIENGKSYNASDLTVSDSDEYVLYITRTDNNNGVSMCVVDEEYEGIEEKDAITIGDTTATIFYQDRKFVTGPHMVVIRAEWFNVYTAQFLIAILNMEKYRYPVFGRAFLKELVRETEIILPVDANKNVDYQFMEDYIKSLPYSGNI